MRNLVLILVSALGLIGFFMIAEAQAAYEPTLGDADCNGSVSAVDASLVLRYTAGLQDYNDCLSLADVDCDVDIDAVDALSILKYVAGMPSKAHCAPGNAVPADDPETVVSSQTLVDPQGETIGSLVVTAGEGSSPTTAASYYRSCWSEVAAKNIFGQKVAWLKHNQSFTYDGSRVTYMFTPWRSAGSMLGWDVDNLSTSGPHNYGSWGQSWSSARFKFSVPVIGTVQSYWVNAGVNVYGWGGCWSWT